MFVTTPSFEQFMPTNLVAPGRRHWRAVDLSTEEPWFVFVYMERYREGKAPQTKLVGWESTLIDVIRLVPQEDRIAVARVGKVEGPSGLWQLQWIEALWEALPDELQETGALLLQLEGDATVRDAFMEPVPARSDRPALFKAQDLRRVQPTPPFGPREEERSMYGPIPEDFPHPVAAGAVPGAQAKVNVRLVGGIYTDDAGAERAERFDICQDLLNQLIAYTEQKATGGTETPPTKLVGQVLAQLEKKQFGWGLSPAEAHWLASRLKAHFRCS